MEIKNQLRLKNCNLNIILTCNIYVRAKTPAYKPCWSQTRSKGACKQIMCKGVRLKSTEYIMCETI